MLVDRQALADAGLLGVRQPRQLPGDAARGRDARRVARQDAQRCVQGTLRQRPHVPQHRERHSAKTSQRAENYLSLVGLVILVLGGIGVSSVTRVFVEQKLKSIAILKCVGAATRQVLRHLHDCRSWRSGWRAACWAWRWPPPSSAPLPDLRANDGADRRRRWSTR